ncbi:MAG: FtsX-like permease family protein [Bacteroidota bacterium]
MSLPFFIAKRLSTNRQSGYSGLIIRIAIAAVAISIAVMIIAVAIVKGYKVEIRNKIIGFSTHIQITRLDLNNSYQTTPLVSDTLMEHLISNQEGISHVQKFAIKAGIIKTKDEFEGLVLKGVDKGYDWKFIQQHLKQGTVINFEDSITSNDIILSQKTVDKLNLKLGDAVLMYFVQDPPRARRFKLTGIYKTGFDEMDALYAFADLRHVQKLNNWNTNEINGYEIGINDYEKLDEMAEKVTGFVPYNMEVRSIRKMHPQLFDWLNLLDLNVLIIIILMIAVACINMSTALLILIVERNNMIGILKALGARNSSVRNLFLYMASYLMIGGMLIGNIIGIGLCWSEQKFAWLKLPQEAYYLSEVPVKFETTDILFINIGAFIICLLVLIIPSRFVLRISPAKAIKFE